LDCERDSVGTVSLLKLVERGTWKEKDSTIVVDFLLDLYCFSSGLVSLEFGGRQRCWKKASESALELAVRCTIRFVWANRCGGFDSFFFDVDKVADCQRRCSLGSVDVMACAEWELRVECMNVDSNCGFSYMRIFGF